MTFYIEKRRKVKYIRRTDTHRTGTVTEGTKVLLIDGKEKGNFTIAETILFFFLDVIVFVCGGFLKKGK